MNAMPKKTVADKKTEDAAPLVRQLRRIADGLERIIDSPAVGLARDSQLRQPGQSGEALVAPSPSGSPRLSGVYRWDGKSLIPVVRPWFLPLSLLVAIEPQKRRLLENTGRFLAGRPAQHALLWGARGCGKSALIKSVWWSLQQQAGSAALIEVPPCLIDSINDLVDIIDNRAEKVIFFIDELALDDAQDRLPILKSLLDGSLQELHALVYATSNRRHLLARAMTENTDLVNPGESIDASVSLSDRFGLWLGFHPISQTVWLEIISRYLEHLSIPPLTQEEAAAAIIWQQQRSGRSGRLAWQYFLEIADKRGLSIDSLRRGLMSRAKT